MSIRESRLCDYKDARGDLCPKPALATCPLCDQDKCYSHFGKAWVRSAIISGEGDMREGHEVCLALGSGSKVNLCTACYELLTSGLTLGAPGSISAHDPLEAPAKTVDVLTALRAYLTQKSLKK